MPGLAPLADLPGLVARHGAVARATVVRAEGSAPQGVGAAMSILPDGEFEGTIGGGALEHAALRTARRMLSAPPAPWARLVQDFPLGPALGQCCGGRVTLLFEVFRHAEAAALAALAGSAISRPLASGLPPVSAVPGGDWTVRDGWFTEPAPPALAPLFLYGAGHVGRAVVRAFEGLPFHIYWVDVARDRFPEQAPAHVEILPAAEMTIAAARAPGDAWHVVMTFAHQLDFEICRTVLARGDFSYLGLIASKTKRARFLSRLRDAGLPDGALARLHAPLGLPGLKAKAPAEIATSLAADILVRRAEAASIDSERAAR